MTLNTVSYILGFKYMSDINLLLHKKNVELCANNNWMKSNTSLYFPWVKTKETKKEIKLKALSFIKLNQTFWITRTLKSLRWDKSDHNQNSHMWLKYNKKRHWLQVSATKLVGY